MIGVLFTVILRADFLRNLETLGMDKFFFILLLQLKNRDNINNLDTMLTCNILCTILEHLILCSPVIFYALFWNTFCITLTLTFSIIVQMVDVLNK